MKKLWLEVEKGLQAEVSRAVLGTWGTLGICFSAKGNYFRFSLEESSPG